MARTAFLRLFLLAALFFIIPLAGLTAHSVSLGLKDPAVGIDLPEGYRVTDLSKDGKSFQLQCDFLPVQLIIKIYDKKAYKSAKEAVDDNLTRLKAKSDCESFKWRYQEAALSSFTCTLGSQKVAGYAASAVLPQDAGTIVLLSWTEEASYEKAANFILSTLDSLCIDYGSYFSPGLVTAYAFPATDKEKPVSLEIGGQTIKSSIKDNDAQAADYLIEREYEVLTLYASQNNWQQAWKRYYRMIFKDSYARLKRPAFDIYNALMPSCSDDTDLAQKLLSWTQSFSYEREKNNSDFASLPSILLGGGSDCDSRSMLIAVLLRAMNMDSCMFISATFSHALAGFVSSHPGHSFTADGKKYLMGETTAKGLTWGKISSEMDDQSKWLAVDFPM